MEIALEESRKLSIDFEKERDLAIARAEAAEKQQERLLEKLSTRIGRDESSEH